MPRLRAGQLSSNLRLDGVLDELEWNQAESIDSLTTIEPQEGGVSIGRTVIKVMADRKSIVFGILCEDPEPNRIVSFSKARDSFLEEEDHLRIVIDPFQDGRTGYVFALNPSGARYDALVAERGESEDSNWDGIWSAATNRGAAGWSAEIVIPIYTLSFPRGSNTWNLNVQRRIQRFQETSRWASPEVNYRDTQTSRAGQLTGLPDFDLGYGISIRPSVVLGATNPAPLSQTNFEGDPSLDVTKKLGPNMLSYLTLNTDFAETEVDTRQINLTRFPLFFPEKRTFFLEGSDIFEFGLGLDTDVIPFFSRRIGLVEEQEVPLNIGGKLNGRIGRTNIGFLTVHTGDVEDLVQSADLGVVRVKQDVFSESSLGMIATFGDPTNIENSWLTGLDFTYQTSKFRGDKNFLIGVWGLINDREDLKGQKSAYGLKIDYPNDLWDIALKYKRIGDGFDPSLGFVPRNGINIYSASVVFSPRPGWKLVRQMFHVSSFRYVTDLNGNWQTYEGFFAPINWQLESGDQFEINFLPEGDRPEEPFEISEGVNIEPGSYQWHRYGIEAETAAKRRLAAFISYEWGDFYDGKLKSTEFVMLWNPLPLITLEFSTEHHDADLSAGSFTQDLSGIRLKLNFSPDMQLSSLLQYDTESNSVGTNTRFRWTITPYVDLFVIYNHNIVEEEGRWIRESNQLQIKFQYTFRR